MIENSNQSKKHVWHAYLFTKQNLNKRKIKETFNLYKSQIQLFYVLDIWFYSLLFSKYALYFYHKNHSYYSSQKNYK